MGNYTARKAGKRWLEGAPAYILDVFDDKRTCDRYTVVFGREFAYHTLPDGKCEEGFGELSNTYMRFLGMSNAPSHPQGVSMWGELKAYDLSAYRYRNAHCRVRWLDLPEHIREHVRMRAEEDAK